HERTLRIEQAAAARARCECSARLDDRPAVERVQRAHLPALQRSAGTAGESDRGDRLADLQRLALGKRDGVPVPVGDMQEADIACALRVFAGDLPRAAGARDAYWRRVPRDVAIRHDNPGSDGYTAADAEPALHASDLDTDDARRERKERRRLQRI